MEMLCPECLGPLVSDDGLKARCTVHGAEFKILFSRVSSPSWAANASLPPVIEQANPGMCIQHPNLKAAFVCGACGQPICSLCAFPRDDGTRICPQCATTPAAAGPRLVGQGDLPPAHVHALKCLQHPNVSAVQVCKVCGAPVCATCDFVLPGNLHVCPKCVAAPPSRISSGRRKLIIAAYVLAIWGTLGMVAFMTGAAAGVFKSAGGEAAVGAFYSIFLFIPALVGGALGISCFDRRLRNPPSVWGAVIWNSVLLVIHIALVIIGNLSK